MLDLWVNALTHVTGRVDCFGCVCPPDSKIKYSVFYNIECVYVHVLCRVILLISFMQLSGKFLCYSQTIKILYFVWGQQSE